MKVMAKKAKSHEKHDCPLKPTECPLGCGDLMNARDIPYVLTGRGGRPGGGGRVEGGRGGTGGKECVCVCVSEGRGRRTGVCVVTGVTRRALC